MKKSLKKNETRIRRKQSRYYNKLVPVERVRDDENLALTLHFLERIVLILISSFAIDGCFQKVNFQGFNLGILNFELPSAFLYALCDLFEK